MNERSKYFEDDATLRLGHKTSAGDRKVGTVGSRSVQAVRPVVFQGDKTIRETNDDEVVSLSAHLTRPRSTTSSMPPTSWVNTTLGLRGQEGLRPRSSSWTRGRQATGPDSPVSRQSSSSHTCRIKLPALAPEALRQDPGLYFLHSGVSLPSVQVGDSASVQEAGTSAPGRSAATNDDVLSLGDSPPTSNHQSFDQVERQREQDGSTPTQSRREDTVMTGTAEDHKHAKARRHVSDNGSSSTTNKASPCVKGLDNRETLEKTIFKFADSADHAKTIKVVQHSRAHKAAHFYAHARAAFKIHADQEDTVLQAEVEGMEGELFLVRGDERDFKDMIGKIETWWETKVEKLERNGRVKCEVVVRLL